MSTLSVEYELVRYVKVLTTLAFNHKISVTYLKTLYNTANTKDVSDIEVYINSEINKTLISMKLGDSLLNILGKYSADKQIFLKLLRETITQLSYLYSIVERDRNSKESQKDKKKYYF